MSNNRQIGIWMDGHQATVVGRENVTTGEFIILGKVEGEKIMGNSNENAANNLARKAQGNFFKDIAKLLTNATHAFITGNGTAQEQFSRFLKETPQFKQLKTTLGTDSQLSDSQLINTVGQHFPG